MSFTPKRNTPVIVQNRDVLEMLAGVAYPVGTFALADAAHDGSVVTISDGVTSTAYTFKSSPAATNDILIGTRAACVTNFMAAVNANTPSLTEIDPERGVVATAGADAYSCVLTNTKPGTLGNVTITNTVHTDHITVTGMAGGAAGSPFNLSSNIVLAAQGGWQTLSVTKDYAGATLTVALPIAQVSAGGTVEISMTPVVTVLASASGGGAFQVKVDSDDTALRANLGQASFTPVGGIWAVATVAKYLLLNPSLLGNAFALSAGATPNYITTTPSASGGTPTITALTIRYDFLWRPRTAGATLTAS